MSKSISKHRALRTVIRYQIFYDPRTIPARLLCPWDFPGKNTGVGHPFPSPGDLPNPRIKPRSLALQADFSLS